MRHSKKKIYSNHFQLGYHNRNKSKIKIKNNKESYKNIINKKSLNDTTKKFELISNNSSINLKNFENYNNNINIEKLNENYINYNEYQKYDDIKTSEKNKNGGNGFTFSKLFKKKGIGFFNKLKK